MSEAQEEITPGGALDRLVAEKMGIDAKPIDHPEHDFIIDYHTYPDYPCKHCGLSEEDGTGKPCVEYPLVDFYSTDIEAAWELVEFMSERNYGFYVNNSKKRGWTAGFIAEEPGKMCSQFQGDTPAHAIVLAFLALTDLEVKE